MSPVVGESIPNSSRMNVDLPEPEGPIRKTNSPLSILTLMSSNAGRADALYFLLTWSRVIITARQCSGEFRWLATISWRVAAMSAPDRAPAGVAAALLTGWCLAGRRAAAADRAASAARTVVAVWSWLPAE